MFKLSIFVLCLLQKVLADQSLLQLSHLNKFELENFKYQIDIDNEIKISNSLNTDQVKNSPALTSSPNLIKIKSVHGQDYECYLPRNDEYFDNAELDSNDDTSSSKTSLNDQFNFTLVYEKIQNYLSNLKDSKTCIYKNLGWWTYEFCFGSEVYQYHLLNNGTIMGEKISLGIFKSDYSWLNANTTSYPVSSGILYHEQYFEMGSMCELSQKPRRTVAKLFCDETNVNQLETIDLISEIETCVYEIHINSFSICKIPYFSKKPNSFNINCNPVVAPDVYDKYVETKKVEETLNDEKYQHIIEQQEQTIKENLDLSSTTISSLVDSVANDYLNLDKLSLTSNQLDEEEGKIETEDDDFNDENTETKMKIIKKDTMTKLDKLTTRAKIIDSLSQQLTNLIDELTLSDDLETSNKEQPTETDSIDNMEAKKESNTKSTALSGSELDKLLNENDESVNNLESKIAEQLSQRQELVDKFKTNKFKVKIVKFDMNNQNELKILGENDSDDLTSIMSSLFDDEIQAQKFNKLQKNYDFVYSNQNSEKQTTNYAKDSTKSEKDETNDKLVIY